MVYSPEQIAQMKEIMEGVTKSSQESMKAAMKEIAEARPEQDVKLLPAPGSAGRGPWVLGGGPTGSGATLRRAACRWAPCQGSGGV